MHARCGFHQEQELTYNPTKRDWTATVAKLHFEEPTTNNSRRNNKINSEQRFFSIVVSIDIAFGNARCTLTSVMSDKLVVRSSHPKQFSLVEPISARLSARPQGLGQNTKVQGWMSGVEPNSTCFLGRVGVNTRKWGIACDMPSYLTE